MKQDNRCIQGRDGKNYGIFNKKYTYIVARLVQNEKLRFSEL